MDTKKIKVNIKCSECQKIIDYDMGKFKQWLITTPNDVSNKLYIFNEFHYFAQEEAKSHWAKEHPTDLAMKILGSESIKEVNLLFTVDMPQRYEAINEELEAWEGLQH